jgi:serine protease AprX
VGLVRSARLFGVAMAVAGLCLPLAPAHAAAPAGSAKVVVQGRGDEVAAAAAVRRAGGTVTRSLPLIRGVAATLPARNVAALTRDPAIRTVTPDAEVRVTSLLQPADAADVKSVYRDEIGATALAARGATGKHVRIALVDTGVTETPDIAGRIVDVADPGSTPEPLRSSVHCVDFSGEGDCVDRYGHGTFLAGLMVGNGAASGGRFAGVAPGADIVSVKIAGRNGAADVSKVLAAIQWVVSFRSDYGIKVLNLSLGTNSTAPYTLDPLNLAVEQAWQAGITVVVAAGNSGPKAGTISKPGDDPLVITVGAVDDRETPGLSDDRLPNFSSHGPTHDGIAKPDVVTPGARLVSIRLKDSYIEEQAGPGSLAGTAYDAYRRGSGTSMSAAVASGAAALLLERHPDWTPDRVKYAMTATAHKVAARDPRAIGAGLVNVEDADRAPAGLANRDVVTLATGGGSLDASRGEVRLGLCRNNDDCARCDVDGDCPPIEGEQTAQGRMYDADRYARANWTEGSWYLSQWAATPVDTGWYGNTWLGNTWLGNTWLGNTWLGSSWYGYSDSDDSYGKPARGGAWYGAWG